MTFPLLSWEQANPGITGAQKINDIFQRILENKKLGIQNRYMPDTLQAALVKAQQENEYYPKDMMSLIRARNATAGKTEAEIPWVGKLAQSEIGLRGSQANKYGSEATGQNQENVFFNSLFNEGTRQQPQNFQPTQQGEMPTLPPTNENHLRRDINDTVLKHPQENPEAYARLMAQRQQMAQVPQGQALNSLAQQQQPIIEGQYPQNISQLANQQESLKDRMQKYADFQAMKRGQQLPSMEAENAGERERAVLNARAMEKSTEGYLAGERGATNSLQYLNELERSIKKLPNIATAPYIPERMKKMLGSADMQVAIKSATGLMLGQLKSTFGGLGQMRLMEMVKLMESLPNANMGTEAALKVIGQVRNVLEIARAKGSMATQINYLTKNNVESEGLMNMAERVCSPVDSEGNIHLITLKYWKEYAKPEALNALRKGELYIPDNIPTKYLSNDALRQLGTS